jgi:hypothetical protein
MDDPNPAGYRTVKVLKRPNKESVAARERQTRTGMAV